jgi:hypothetical protein
MPVTLLDQQALRYSRALDENFPFFFSEIIRIFKGFTPARTQIEMGEWFQTGPRDRGALAYREMSKTWLLVGYILWRGRKDPDGLKAKLVSKSEGHSKRSLNLAKEWVNTMPFLRHLKPKGGRDSNHRNNDTEYDFGPCSPEAAPSIHAIGIEGQVTGGRANLLGLDDIETPQNCETVNQRETLERRWGELEFLSRHGESIVIGTYHTEESVYLKMAEAGYSFRAWPIRYPATEPKAETAREKILFLAPQVQQRLDDGDNQPGEPLDPDLNPESDIRRQELKVGKSTALRQLMLIPGAADILKYPLHQSDLIVFDAGETHAPALLHWGKANHNGPTNVEGIPIVGFSGDALFRPVMVSDQWLPYRGVKAFLDPAGRGSDHLAVVPCGQLHGYLFIRDLLSIEGPNKTAPANLDRIVQFLRDHRVTELWIESQFGGEYLKPLLLPIIQRHAYAPLEDKDKPGAITHDAYPHGWHCSIELIHATGMKENRIIDTLEPTLNAHRLVVSEKVAANTTLMRQLTRITRQRNCLDQDDELDATAGVVARWAPQLDQDPDLQAQRYEEQLIQETYNEFLKHLNLDTGNPTTQRTSWIHY